MKSVAKWLCKIRAPELSSSQIAFSSKRVKVKCCQKTNRVTTSITLKFDFLYSIFTIRGNFEFICLIELYLDRNFNVWDRLSWTFFSCTTRVRSMGCLNNHLPIKLCFNSFYKVPLIEINIDKCNIFTVFVHLLKQHINSELTLAYFVLKTTTQRR